MLFVSAYRVIKFSIQDFFRNFWLSIVTIAMITLALISINSLIILNLLTATFIESVKDRLDISVNFKQEVSESEIMVLKNYLESQENVKYVEFKSKHDALEELKRDPALAESLKLLDANPLSDSLIIKAKEVRDYQQIVKFFEEPKYEKLIESKKEKINSNLEVIDKVRSISNVVQQFGVGITAIFLVIGLIIVYYTIRLAIHIHKEEIMIMKLVGASNSFIKAPFLISGVIYSVISLVLLLILIYPILGFLQPYIMGYFGEGHLNMINWYNNNFLEVFGLQLLIVVALNFFASSFAVGKYLKI